MHLKYFSRSQGNNGVSQSARQFWRDGGGQLGMLLHPTMPLTLLELSHIYFDREGEAHPPETTFSGYVAYLMCGLLAHGFARVSCPRHWPVAPNEQPRLSFRINPNSETVRQQHTTAWRKYGERIIVPSLQTLTPLTLDDLDDACRQRARHDKSFAYSPNDKFTLAESLLTLAEYDLVQLILPEDSRHIVKSVNGASRST
jgi:hypothetical protein